jgi:hypothetical protein
VHEVIAGCYRIGNRNTQATTQKLTGNIQSPGKQYQKKYNPLHHTLLFTSTLQQRRGLKGYVECTGQDGVKFSQNIS